MGLSIGGGVGITTVALYLHIRQIYIHIYMHLCTHDLNPLLHANGITFCN